MIELTQREKRTIARISAVDISRLKIWSPLSGILFLCAALAEYLYACVDHDHSISFTRVMLLLAVGGGLIEHPRINAIIQKLSQAPDVKEEIAKINVRAARRKFWALFVLTLVLFWLFNYFFSPRIGI